MKRAVALLVVVLCRAQVPRDLEQRFEQVLAYRLAHPLALDGALQEGQLLLKMQRPAEAKQIVEQACQVHTESLECLALEAEICEKLNQPEEAKELLTRCTRRTPDDPKVWKWLGDFELRRKDPAAIGSFRKAADLRPDDAQAWAGMAASEEEAGASAKATRDFEKAVALNAARAQPSAMIYLLYADHLRNAGEWQRAADAYTRALALEADLMAAYLGRGRSRMELSKLEAARADLERCEHDSALQLEALNLLFKIYKAEKNAPEAERYAHEIQRISDRRMEADAAGNEVASALARGSELLRKGHIAEAQTVYEGLARAHPEATAAYEGVARVLAQSGHYPEAEKAIGSYLASAADDPAAHALLGRILLAQHRVPEARSEFQAAIRLDPLLAEAQMGEAACDILSGHYAHAVETLRRTLKLPSVGADCRLMLSEALYKNNQRSEALRELDLLLKREPKNNRALQMKQAVERTSCNSKPCT